MAYKHRFYDFLIPNQQNNYYLFIGTFNPNLEPFEITEGPYDKDYFYGRATNLFWCICPHAFNQPCLVDKEVSDWKSFCEINGIGLTDLIKEVIPYQLDKERDKANLTYGYADNKLEQIGSESSLYKLDFNTKEINNYIDENKSTLRGVYFTRKSFSAIPRIKEQWKLIENHCKQLHISCVPLPTPSTWGIGLRQTISEWKHAIMSSGL